MKTKLNIAILLLLSISLFAPAQKENNKRPSLEELREGKWKYMVETVKLTGDDANKLKPLFNEFEDNVWNVVKANKEAFKGRWKKDKTPEDFEKMNENLVNYDIKKAELQKEYYTKMKKVVSPEVVHKMLRADRNFLRDLMRKHSNPPPPPPVK